MKHEQKTKTEQTEQSQQPEQAGFASEQSPQVQDPTAHPPVKQNKIFLQAEQEIQGVYRNVEPMARKVQKKVCELLLVAQEKGTQLLEKTTEVTFRAPSEIPPLLDVRALLCLCVAGLIVCVFAFVKSLEVKQMGIIDIPQTAEELYIFYEQQHKDVQTKTLEDDVFYQELSSLSVGEVYTALGREIPNKLQKQADTEPTPEEKMKEQIAQIDERYEGYFVSMRQILQDNQHFFIVPGSNYEKIIPESDLLELSKGKLTEIAQDKIMEQVDKLLPEVSKITGFISMVDTLANIWNSQPEYLREYHSKLILENGILLSAFMEDGALNEQTFGICVNSYEALYYAYDNLRMLNVYAKDGGIPVDLPEYQEAKKLYENFLKDQAQKQLYTDMLGVDAQ